MYMGFAQKYEWTIQEIYFWITSLVAQFEVFAAWRKEMKDNNSDRVWGLRWASCDLQLLREIGASYVMSYRSFLDS